MSNSVFPMGSRLSEGKSDEFRFGVAKIRECEGKSRGVQG
jgi:hypothetical protein